MMIMSNIFLLSSLLFLASDAAGCSSEDDEACSKRIYGFYPSSLISNIGIISGLLSAFLMPVCGAMVDFTPHRRLIGIILVIFLTVIQGVQVGTVAATWFAMLVLQGIAGFFYQLQVVAVYAYLPEIAREVGEPKMAIFCRNFTCSQFAAQFLFLVVVVVIQISAKTGVVLTAQISQGINTTTCILFFTLGWIKYMTTRPAAHVLPEGHNLLLEGFRQNWRTAKNTQRFFKKGLRWYFLALIFAESGRSQLWCFQQKCAIPRTIVGPRRILIQCSNFPFSFLFFLLRSIFSLNCDIASHQNNSCRCIDQLVGRLFE